MRRGIFMSGWFRRGRKGDVSGRRKGQLLSPLSRQFASCGLTTALRSVSGPFCHRGGTAPTSQEETCRGDRPARDLGPTREPRRFAGRIGPGRIAPGGFSCYVSIRSVCEGDGICGLSSYRWLWSRRPGPRASILRCGSPPSASSAISWPSEPPARATRTSPGFPYPRPGM